MSAFRWCVVAPSGPIIAPMIHVRPRRVLSPFERAALGAIGGGILGALLGGMGCVERFARLGAYAALSDPREVVS